MTSSNPWHPRVVFLKIDVLLRAGSILTPLTPGIGGGARSFPAIENVSSHQLKRALGSRTSLENCVARQWDPSVWFRSVNNGMRNMVRTFPFFVDYLRSLMYQCANTRY